MSNNWMDKARKSLEARGGSATTQKSTGTTDWKDKAKKGLESRGGYVPEAKIDYNAVSATLKKDLATALGSGNFDKDKSRSLVESYAGVQFKIFDENLKKGHTGIKPIGENLSNLFKAHGYDFSELYPELAEIYSSGNDANGGVGNIEAYAYNNSDAFKQKWDDRQEYEAVKGALLDKAVATNEKREHERSAEMLSDEKKEIESHSGGFGNWKGAISNEYNESRLDEVNKELAAEKKAAAEAAAKEIYADEALFATRIMYDVMSRPDFEEKSKYNFTTTPTVGPTTTGLDKNFIGQGSFEDVEFDDGTSVSIHARGFTEDQYKVYMYLLNTEGEESATRFENGIKNTLNSMAAQRSSQLFQEMEKGNPLEKFFSAVGQGGMALASGVEGLGQAALGIADTFTGDTEYFMSGIAQMTTAKNKEKTGFAGKLVLGASEAMPQVLGTAALGAVNPILGAVFLGGTAYGSSYVDAINSGATRGQAITMGVMNAALEIALEKWVGSTIDGFGDSLSKRIGKGVFETKLGKNLITSFNDFARIHPKRAIALGVAGRMFGNSSSEFVEEYLAETAAPILRNIILGEDKDITLWSQEQKEAALIGFITGSILEGARGSVTLSNLKTDYGINVERIKLMPDSKVLEEYKAKFGEANISADKARQTLLDGERFVAATVAMSEYAKEGLSYEEAAEKAETLGIDIDGFEEFTKSAYELGRSSVTQAESDTGKRLTYKGGSYSNIGNLIREGEATSYIADKVMEFDGNLSRDEVIKEINTAKQRAFMESLDSSSMSDFDKANAIKRYTIKERNLEMMYEMGRQGFEFDSSMVTEVLSPADAEKAFIRGQNARMLASGPSVEVGSVDFSGENLVVPSDVAAKKDSSKSINDYIDYSIEYGKTLRENPDADIQKQESSKIIGNASERLINDMSSDYGVDLSGKVHALIDNDIRHIINSHGEGTNEKYPVTADDLKQIPDIVENYDDVLYLPRKDGKKGIIYVKQHNGITYYLESIQNDNMLRNKQMIKVSTGTIPDLPGLQDAINTKWKHTQSFPDDKIPRMYGLTVRTGVSTNNSISDSSSDVNTVISSIGSEGVGVYKSIMNSVTEGGTNQKTVDSYKAAFAHVYNAGKNGVPYKRSSAQPLRLTQINAIYDAAKKDAARQRSAGRKANARLIRDDIFKKAKISNREGRMLEALAKMTGRDIRFSDELSGNAKINLDTGEIIISTKAKTGVRWAAIHEAFHAMRVDAPAEANKLINTVLDIIKKNPAAFRSALNLYVDRYGSELFDSDGKLKLNAEDIIEEEMAADMIGFVVSNSKVLSTITGEQRNILQRFIDKITGYFDKFDLSAIAPEARQSYLDVYNEIDKIAEQFAAAFEVQKDVVRNADGRAEKKTSETEAENVKNSVELIKGTTMKYVKADRQVITGKDPKQWAISVEKYINEKIRNNNDVNLLADDGDILTLTSDTAGKAKYRNSVRRGNDVVDTMTDNEYLVKLVTESHIDEIAKASKQIPKNATPAIDTKNHPFAKDGFLYRTAYFMDFDGKYYKLTISVGINNGVKTVYNIGKIKETTFPQGSSKAQSTKGAAGTNVVSTNNYTQKNGNVNTSNGKNSRDLSGKDAKRAKKKTYDLVKKSKDLSEGKIEPKKTAELSEKDTRELLEMTQYGLLNDNTYIPIRRNLPSSFVEIVNDHAKRELFTNEYAVASEVEHMRQNMEEEDDSSYGDNRPHGLTTDDIIQISREMSTPAYIVLQKNGRYAMVVSYYDGRTKHIVVSIDPAIDAKSQKHNYKYASYMNGYEGGYYNIVVTEYEPDNLKTYLDGCEIIFDKKEMNGKYQVGSGRVVTFTHDAPFIEDIIPQDKVGVNSSNEKHSRDLSGNDENSEASPDLIASLSEKRLKRWGAEIAGTKDSKIEVLAPEMIIKKVEKAFGVPITKGGTAETSDKNYVSMLRKHEKTITSKYLGDLPEISHALGYYIDDVLSLTERISVQNDAAMKESGEMGILAKELQRILQEDYIDISGKEIQEGFAEFVRVYLMSKETAHHKAPMMTEFFEKAISEDRTVKDAVESSAKYISDYLGADFAPRLTAMVMNRAEADKFTADSLMIKAGKAGKGLYQNYVDRNSGIYNVLKRINKLNLGSGFDPYVMATNLGVTSARSAEILTRNFVNYRGDVVGESLASILKDVGDANTENYKLFNEYLFCRHAPSWLDPHRYEFKGEARRGTYKPIFKDEVLNNADSIRQRGAEIEAAHPEFKALAQRVYKYQDNLQKYYIMEAGGISRDQYDELKLKYPNYVPLMRYDDVAKEYKSKKISLANLPSPIKLATGGSGIIISPMESIMRSTMSAVDFYQKNRIVTSIGDIVTGKDGVPGIMERVYSTKELKELLEEAGENPNAILQENVLDKEFHRKNPYREEKTNSEFLRAANEVLSDSDEIAISRANNAEAIRIFEHTPKIILDSVQGSSDLPVIINYSKLYLASRENGALSGHYHNLGYDIGKILPKALNSPDAILRMDNGRLNIISSVQIKDKNNLLVSVELDSTKRVDGKHDKYNVVVTVFDASDNYIDNLLREHAVSVEYEKEDLPQVKPQLHNGLAIINGKSSSMDSIPRSVYFVNELTNKKETSESQTQHLSTTGAVENQSLHMTELLERAVSVGNSISQGDGFVNEQINKRGTEEEFTPVASAKAQILFAWKDGKKVFYKVHDVELYNSLANLSEPQLGLVFRASRQVLNLRKIGVTSGNILFTISNFYRDFMTYRHNTTDVLAMQVFRYVTSFTDIVLANFGVGKNAALYEQFLSLGGSGTSIANTSIDALGRAVRKLQNQNKSVVERGKDIVLDWKHGSFIGHTFKGIIDVFCVINEVIEHIPRFSQFKKEVSKHGDSLKAFYEANDVTTNFSRRGLKSAHANSLFMFFNASVQGLDKARRSYISAGVSKKEAANRVFRDFTTAMLFFAAMAAFNRDDEAKEAYEMLSEYTKRNYDCFYIGDGKFLKLPKERELAIFRSAWQMFAEYMVLEDEKTFNSFTEYCGNWFTYAIGNIGLTASAGNTAAGPIIEAWSNKNYRGEDIVPEYLSMSTEYKHERYQDDTSVLSVNLAKFLYDMAGIDISPLSIDHVITGYGGWFGDRAVGLMPQAEIAEKGFSGVAKDKLSNPLDFLGFKNRYTADARYSTDLINNVYAASSQAEIAIKRGKTGKTLLDGEKYIGFESYVSVYNKLSKGKSLEERRNDRYNLQKQIMYRDDSIDSVDEWLIKLYDETGVESIFFDSYPNFKSGSFSVSNNGVKWYVTLDAASYSDFCADIDAERHAVREMVMRLGLEPKQATYILDKVSGDITTAVKQKWASAKGVPDYGESKKKKVYNEKKNINLEKSVKEEVKEMDKMSKEEFEKALDNIIYGE